MYFAIPVWRALTPFHQTKEDWQKWIEQGQDTNVLLPSDIDLSFLSAIKRRRLSTIARLMFAAAWPLLSENTNCPVVFVSHDGEVNRSFKLWQSFVQQEELSPTAFALSVHNAIIGQWSLMRADMSESVAICAKYNGLEVGIVEALGLLDEGAQQVLVVVVDEPISLEYAVKAERAPFPLALALIVTKGQEINLTFIPDQSSDFSDQAKKTVNYYSSTLAWIVQQITTQSVRTQADMKGVWRWQCN